MSFKEQLWSVIHPGFSSRSAFKDVLWIGVFSGNTRTPYFCNIPLTWYSSWEQVTTQPVLSAGGLSIWNSVTLRSAFVMNSLRKKTSPSICSHIPPTNLCSLSAGLSRTGDASLKYKWIGPTRQRQSRLSAGGCTSKPFGFGKLNHREKQKKKKRLCFTFLFSHGLSCT